MKKVHPRVIPTIADSSPPPSRPWRFGGCGARFFAFLRVDSDSHFLGEKKCIYFTDVYFTFVHIYCVRHVKYFKYFVYEKETGFLRQNLGDKKCGRNNSAQALLYSIQYFIIAPRHCYTIFYNSAQALLYNIL